MSSKEKQPIKPAGTVALIRDVDLGIEVLMLRRNKALAFAAGAWVFPGGSVDPSDLAGLQGDEQAAAQVAACREAQEECGLSVSPDDLQAISHWTTPEGEPRRFSTWLFVAGVNGHAEVTIDEGEIHDAIWLSPAAALERHAQGQMKMLPPTYMTLKAIAPARSVAEVTAALRGHNPVVVEPHGALIEGGFTAMYPGDAGFHSLDPDIPGPRHRSEMREGIITSCVSNLPEGFAPLDSIGL
ncbi:MAG: hypothetical protein RI942_94 [Pseudomonadota bacterium]